MALTVKKETFFNLFWLLFFLLFFAIPFKKVNLFTINVSGTEGGVSLVFLLFSFFQKLIVENHGFTPLLLSILLVLLAVLSLFVISFMLIKIFHKLQLNVIPFFKQVDNIIEKFLTAKTIYILLFLFLISFALRFMYMSDGLLHHDSVQTAIATEQTLETGQLHGIVGYRYGFILINTIAYSIPHYFFGVKSSEFTITFVTILFASLSIGMFYLFMKEFFGNKYTAIVSSLIFSLNPIYLSVTTYAKDHALSVFLLLLTAYFLVKMIKTDSTIYKILFSISLGFSLFVRVSDVFVSLPFFFMIYFLPGKFFNEDAIKFKKKFSMKNMFIILLPLLIALILFFIYQKGAVSGGLAGNLFFSPNADWFDMTLSLMMTLSPLGFFLVAYGFFNATKREPYAALLLFIWAMSVFIFYSGFGTSKLRFFVPLFIPLAIVMGTSLDFIRKKYSVLSIFGLIAVLILMLLLIQPALAYRHNYSSGKELALFFANVSEKNAVIIDYGDLGVFYDYYANRKSIECPFLNKPKEFNSLIETINQKLNSGIPIYLNNQCFGFRAEGVTEAIDIFNKNYDYQAIGQIEFENYEDLIKLSPHNFTIYKLRRQQAHK